MNVEPENDRGDSDESPNPRERELFSAALDMPQEQRESFLTTACGEDEALRSRIQSLLQSHLEAGEFLESPAPRLALTLIADEIDDFDEKEYDFEFLDESDKSGCLGALGHYEIIGVVGRGAFGIVFRAFDTKLNRVVAIKVMAPELAQNKMAVRRFSREAQAAAAVVHDHVVTLHAIEEESRPPFLVMEFVEGQSLGERIEEQGLLEINEILRIGMQIASGLNAAHQQGLVHRDIKPANILLENGVKRVKLTDFGLARAVDDIGMTQTGTIAGTPQYMSPEQGLGQSIDERSDLFSLGSVLYTMCTGVAPFRADSTIATLKRVCDDRPKAITELNPDIPRWLANIVNRLLEKKPEKRFQSAEEVESLLRSCLADWQSGKRDMPRIVEHTKRFAKQLQPYAERLHPSRFDLEKVKGWLPSASSAQQLTLVLTVVQTVAIALATVAAFFEVGTIFLSGPLVGIFFGGSIAALAWIAELPKRFILFGLSSCVATIFIFAAIAVFGLNAPDWLPICAMILAYASIAVPCGAVLIQQLWRFPELEIKPISLLDDAVVIPLLGVQLFVIALSGPVVAVDRESAFVMLPILLMIGSLATVLCLLSERHWLTKAFVVSAPVVTFMIAFSLASYATAGGNTPTSALVSWGVVWVVLAYVFCAVPVGLWVLFKESNQTARFKMEKFTILHALVITAVLAMALAMARPSLNFGPIAYLASSLFGVALFGLAGATGLWIARNLQTQKRLLLWFGMSVATLALAIIFMTSMSAYDARANYGYLTVRVSNTGTRYDNASLQEPFTLSVTDEKGETQIHQIHVYTQTIGPIPRGVTQVSLRTGDDLYKLESKEVDLEFRFNDLDVELRSIGDS
ncbi:MAG: serine/threonine-protein kinase [Aureliella sp.]